MAREKKWQSLIDLDALEPGDVTGVVFGTRELAVFDGTEGIIVSYARCTHGAANLCDGYFDGRRIECPLHQGLFDIRSGKALSAPARVPLRLIESKVENNQVYILI